ncbi:MAG: EAL domain-containing protein [Rhodanobacter sp.]|nr:MAG: EAL domain-containing protein [Rhodanobacter sp.]TAM13522.1 MAG: EAL domain-containing protein [Rhodanobacter sp.]TAM35725.1 MAG: EAL domain-containing protein [Rhodanobacter sp.]
MHGLGLAGRLALGCCTALLPAAGVVASAPAPAAGAQPLRIRVVGDNNYPPYLFADADGKLQGYEVDMWRLFQARTGIQVDLQGMPWAEAQRELLAGKADVIDMMFRTPEREPHYDYTAPFATVRAGIYVDRRIHGVHDLATLRGFPIGVERGDACADRLASAGLVDLLQFPNYQGVINAAVRGDVRIFCMDESPADYFLYKDGALDRFDHAFVFYSGQFRRAVRKGNLGMLRVVNRGMAQITPQERVQLAARWLDHPMMLAKYWRAAEIGLGSVLLLLALMLAWVWSLRRNVAARTRELHAQERNVRALFDASPDAIWFKDRQGVLLDANRQVETLFQVPRERLIGRTDSQLFGDAAAADVHTMDAEVLRSGVQRSAICPFPLADGGTREYEVITAPLLEADGAVRGVLSAARDVTARRETEVKLRLWATAFEHGGFGLAIFDARTRCIVAANPCFARERGYTSEEMVNMSVHALYPADLVEERKRMRKMIDAHQHMMVETEQITRDGRRFPVLLDCTTSRDASGEPEFVIVYAQDISGRKRAEAELRLAAVAFETQEALLVSDAQGLIQRVNQAFTRLTGFAPAEVLGMPSSAMGMHGDDSARRSQLAHYGFWQGEQWVRVKQGQPRVVRTAISAVHDAAGKLIHYVYTMVDLTSEREAHASVDRMTYFDSLTELPNRQYLLGYLQHMLGEAGTGGVLLIADLDHFKRINDLRGHAAGDRLLALVARRLRVLADGDCMVGRFGGGTFTMVVPGRDVGPVARKDLAVDYAERLRQQLREPFALVPGRGATVTASIGWTELVPRQDVAETVLREAELAMYAAKAAGRDQVRRFDPDMLADLAQREELVQELRAAIVDDELELYLQPQADREGHIVSAEALLRWTRHDGSQVLPDVFIPVAEDNGLIVPLGAWVLQRACEQLVAWSVEPATNMLSLAANVSAHQFAQPGFVASVRDALKASGADPARLKLEITESAILGDLADAAMKLAQLRSHGIRISLDDFGTGYSSLAYLSRLPIDQLKIDKSFVLRLPADANDAMVAQTIIGMGRGLGLEVIAEGVETEAQQRFLMQHGCDAFQGYLVAKPLPPDEFNTLLKEQVPVL